MSREDFAICAEFRSPSNQLGYQLCDIDPVDGIAGEEYGTRVVQRAMDGGAPMRDDLIVLSTSKNLVGSVFAGLGALVSLWPASTPLRYPHQSDSEALTGDARRVGRDMQRVIDRERAKFEAPAK